MNRILNKYADFEGIGFLPKIMQEFNINLKVEGKENLPENGRCFFVSNHPFGIIDGLVLTLIIAEKYSRLKAIGNDAFIFIPHLRPLIAGVNVFGKNSKEYITALDEVFKSDIPITHFPAGEVSRVYRGRIQDGQWQKSFVGKSIAVKRDIVPVFLYGRNSFLFYIIYVIRKILGIKINLELVLLPGEAFKKRNKTIRMKIGKPISFEKFDKTFSHFEWAQKLKAYVYNMGKSKAINNF